MKLYFEFFFSKRPLESFDSEKGIISEKIIIPVSPGMKVGDHEGRVSIFTNEEKCIISRLSNSKIVRFIFFRGFKIARRFKNLDEFFLSDIFNKDEELAGKSFRIRTKKSSLVVRFIEYGSREFYSLQKQKYQQQLQMAS